MAHAAHEFAAGHAGDLRGWRLWCLGGVDYRPLVEKHRDTAVPNQPYWWRFWRQAEALGLAVYGECMLGWGGANDFGVADLTDLQFPWIYTLSSINSATTPGYRPIAPKHRHALYQVHGTIDVSGHLASELEPENQKKLIEFHRRFLAKHGGPDGLRFVNLRTGRSGRGFAENRFDARGRRSGTVEGRREIRDACALALRRRGVAIRRRTRSALSRLRGDLGRS